MAPPRYKFGTTLDPESLKNFEMLYFSSAIFSGVKDPNADVIQIQISGAKNDTWETLERITLYREGKEYREIPQRQPVQKQESTEETSKEENMENLSEESEENPFQ
jgi:hypothetical protein